MLYGVPEHCLRHDGSVLIQKPRQCLLVPLANFSQHPPCCFVYQVFPVGEQKATDCQRIFELSEPNEVLRGDNRNPTVPETCRFGYSDQRLASIRSS